MGEMADMALEHAFDDNFCYDDEGENFSLVTHRVHITKDRQQIPIIEMEDSHLLNTISLILRRAVAKRQQADAQQKRASANKFQSKLRGTREVDLEELAEEINNNVILADLYITEAVRRGLCLMNTQAALRTIYAD